MNRNYNSKKNNSKITSPLLTALYCRLSLEDGKDNESMSISNQKLLLKDYAEKNGMFNCEFYVDDGFTGRNFNRPAFQRMISDIESGRISCVITKDLSRLGRNYIESGSYMEVFFPKHNVRYIAITDNYDSLNKQEMDIAPFKNILNDMYSRDISKKVLAGRMTRSRQGKFCGGQPPLGLMRDPDDNGHLIIDPETAPIIRRIFDLALDGFGNMKICKVLMEERIPITRMQTGTDCDINYYAWSGSRISTILRNPFYKGAHVVCKTHQKGIRSNTYNIIPREQREVIEDCHEAIIPKAEWDKVQQLIDRRPPIMKGNNCPYYNIFHGIVYCATCGKSMQVRYEKVGRTNKDRRTGKEREPIDKAYYICQTYNRLGKNACTSHKIEARDLYNLVLADIQEVAAMALKDKEAFYGRLSRRMEKQYLADTDSLKKEYENLAQRNQEIDDTFISLYADKAKGILTEKRFLKLTDAMEKEQENNQSRMQEIAALISEEEHSEGDVQMFMGEIRRYAAITELDETVLNRLINRILIGEPKKVDGIKTQEVRIVYNFVGEL
ncbi:MAG: recombinase family protein [Lachnospiraceae bacterium]|jgi:DNA invertase Pin-like site-specific DNA recombinase